MFSSQFTIVRTSQKGTITAVNGSIRPIILFRSPSGRPDTAASVWTGVPIAPHATGAVFAIKFKDGRLEWPKAQADHESACNRYRRAKPGGPFNERSKAKRYQQQLQPPIRRDCCDGLLHDFKLSGLDRNVVEKNSGNNNPHDFQQAESDAIKKARRGELDGHRKDCGCTQ